MKLLQTKPKTGWWKYGRKCWTYKEWEQANERIYASIRIAEEQEYDVTKAPLLRVMLVQLSKSKHLMVFDAHHLVVDGQSSQILINDFLHLYKGMELPTVKVRYRDYVKWQNSQYESNNIKQQEKYYKKHSLFCAIFPCAK